MNKLVEEIIKPILEANGIKKVIGIYGGRFQPFGPHHFKTYKWLQSKVDEAYITTSNIKKPPRHPMNFKEKVRHMTKMGVPKNRIIEEKSPYNAKNLAKKFDKDTTAFVYVFGAKDAGRLGGKYFQDYKKSKGNIKGFEQHGYYLVAPHVSISVGGKEVSGTTMRELLGSDKFDDKERVKLFKKMFGYFNQGVFNMMTNKFKKLFENDMLIIPWDNTKPKPKNPKLFDKKKRDLLKGIKLPIKVGDTVKMGKFKNKKVVIKSIGYNEKGDLVINGRPALKFRIIKSQEIDEFIINKNVGKIIKEITSLINAGDMDEFTLLNTGQQMVDSGPSMFVGGKKAYVSRMQKTANDLGWEVINYILNVDVEKVPPFKKELNQDIPPVTPLPAGIGTGGTPNNPENLDGTEAFNVWKKRMNSIANVVGFELINFKQQKENEKEIKKQVAKDTVDTIKQQEKEEVEENVFTKDWWKKELLNEGGAYGHMAHPFDDKELTFGDLKKIIELGLGGQLNREDNVTEKLDGQNIMVSFKDGKLIAARNKGHIKNGGKTALDGKGIAAKFKGRGEIKNAFVFAMKDLEKAIKSLSDKQKEKIFNNGYNFMNLEVMYPASANVIDYDVTQLIFHGALKYNDKGNVIGEVPGSGRILAGMIQQRNQNIQKKYSIGKPVFLNVPKHQDFGKMKGKFLGRLSKLQSKFGLSDNDTLGLYHQKWWEQYILKQLKKISPKVLEGLVKRWAFFDKSYKIPQIKQDLKDTPIFLEWVLKTDKENHAKIVKDNMKPFEILFFEVGAEILKNVKGFISANPKKSVQSMVKKLDKAISDVRSGGDVKKLNKLKGQLEKLNAIGGVDAIVPSEGLVFKYKGKTYKFTGAFAPINQITGLIYF